MARQMSKLDKRLMSSRQRVGRTNLYTNIKGQKKVYAGGRHTLKTGRKSQKDQVVSMENSASFDLI